LASQESIGSVRNSGRRSSNIANNGPKHTDFTIVALCCETIASTFVGQARAGSGAIHASVTGRATRKSTHVNRGWTHSLTSGGLQFTPTKEVFFISLFFRWKEFFMDNVRKLGLFLKTGLLFLLSVDGGRQSQHKEESSSEKHEVV